MRETAPLKSLASNVLVRLERNKPGNKRETFSSCATWDESCNV